MTHFQKNILNLVKKSGGTWLAQNNTIANKIIKSIPIGIQDARINNQQYICSTEKNKTNNIYCNFRIHASRESVQTTIQRQGIKKRFDSTRSISNYFTEMASHRFIVSPEGAGIDCHRTWEAIYLGCIPIVLSSRITRDMSKYYPMIILKSWNEIESIEFSAELYHKIVGEFDRKRLEFDALWDLLIY